MGNVSEKKDLRLMMLLSKILIAKLSEDVKNVERSTTYSRSKRNVPNVEKI